MPSTALTEDNCQTPRPVAPSRRNAGVGRTLGAANWFAYETAYTMTATNAPRAREPAAGSSFASPEHRSAQ
eukprot:5125845-Pyramimonas_sp.AAC.1